LSNQKHLPFSENFEPQTELHQHEDLTNVRNVCLNACAPTILYEFFQVFFGAVRLIDITVMNDHIR